MEFDKAEERCPLCGFTIVEGDEHCVFGGADPLHLVFVCRVKMECHWPTMVGTVSSIDTE